MVAFSEGLSLATGCGLKQQDVVEVMGYRIWGLGLVATSCGLKQQPD